MNQDVWYTTFFDEDYMRIYSPFLSPELTEQEVTGIVDLLSLSPGSTILDLCCGYGRHTIALAKRGYNLVGLDLSAYLLSLAQAEAEVSNVQVRWLQSDMRNIPFEHEFDAIINISTAFGYLENEDEDQKVLLQVHKALKPGGVFLLEMVQRESFIRRYKPCDITRLDTDGLIILEERRFNLLTCRDDVRETLLFPDCRKAEHSYSLRIYSLRELEQMLSAAHLHIQAYYGGWDRSQLTLDSLRLVLICRKEEQPLAGEDASHPT